MEAMQGQVRALVDEIGTLRNEVVAVKAAHAQLHQTTVDVGATSNRLAAEQASRFENIESKLAGLAKDAGSIGRGGNYKKPLIEPKQVVVEVFAGALNDTRGKFLDWAEKVKDRTGLW